MRDLGRNTRDRAERAGLEAFRFQGKRSLELREGGHGQRLGVERPGFRIDYRPIDRITQPGEIGRSDRKIAGDGIGRGALEGQIARERISARLPAYRGKRDLLPIHRHFRVGLQRHAAAKLRQANGVHDEIGLDVGAFERHVGAALTEIGGRNGKGTVHRKMRALRREAQFRLGGRAERAVEFDG